MKACGVYERGGKLLVQASSRTDQGVWILDGDVFELASDADEEALGQVVSTALQQSSTVPHPTQWGGLMKPLLTKAGVKSWRTFVRGTRCVRVKSERGGWTALPYRNLGPSEGFEEILGVEIAVSPNGSAAALGRAVREALEVALS